eukprot:5574067-Prymnesium_polylepis.1
MVTVSGAASPRSAPSSTARLSMCRRCWSSLGTVAHRWTSSLPRSTSWRMLTERGLGAGTSVRVLVWWPPLGAGRRDVCCVHSARA